MYSVSVSRNLLIAVSMITLAGCVSAVTDDKETAAAAISGTSSQTAQNPSSAAAAKANQSGKYVDPAMVSAAQQGGAAQAGQASAASQVYGSAPDLAGLTTQPTSISAGTTSIYANPQAGVAETDATTGAAQTTPAYVPVPGINPALNSVYSAPPPQLQPHPPQAAQESSANIVKDTVAPAVAQIPAPKAEGNDSDSKSKSGMTLAAFFAGAAKKRTAKATPEKPDDAAEVAALPQSHVSPADTGIALQGRSTMSDKFDDEHVEMEDDAPVGLMKLASLSGLSRVAPNGLFLQTDKVEVGCFKPELVKMIKDVEAYYNRPAIITSGLRPAKSERRGSKHYTCDAADIQIEGVSKWELANHLRSLPNRGGVGTYCHTESVHLDTGEARDWNWRCRRTAQKS